MTDHTTLREEISGAEPDSSGVRLAVVSGELVVDTADGTGGTAELSWPEDTITIELEGTTVSGGSCHVGSDRPVIAIAQHVEPRVEYAVTISRDRMHASLRVKLFNGRERTLIDTAPTSALRLRVTDTQTETATPLLTDALAALQGAGVVAGVDIETVKAALTTPGNDHIVAEGRDAIPGRNGYVQPLIDFDAVRYTGVPIETALLRRVIKRDGTAGHDVTGKELRIRPVRDVRLKLGDGVAMDEHGLLAFANVDGQPAWDGDAFIEVRRELTIATVDTSTGDIHFCGSVRVAGDVHEGRRVVAGHDLLVEGNVDRAHLESSGSMEVWGTIMSSVLRAGGERAVAASIIDRVAEAPNQLSEAATRARELRDAAKARGTELSHALSIQLVIERMYRPMLSNLLSASEELRESGPEHAWLADAFASWHRTLSTAAVSNLSTDGFMTLLNELGRHVDTLRRAVEHSSDLSVRYMQASEAEATGKVTLAGKGIFNSSITAWEGLIADHPRAVVRGGSIISHGPVVACEIGSPGGATMRVQLGKGSSLDANLVYAGTLITGPGHAHRFIADRSNVKIRFDDHNGMNVDSLAA